MGKKIFDELTVDWVINEANRLAKEGKTRMEITQILAKELDSTPRSIDRVLTEHGWRKYDVVPTKFNKEEFIKVANECLEEGLSRQDAVVKLSKTFGISFSSVYSYLKKYDLFYKFKRHFKTKNQNNNAENELKNKIEQFLDYYKEFKMEVWLLLKKYDDNKHLEKLYWELEGKVAVLEELMKNGQR